MTASVTRRLVLAGLLVSMSAVPVAAQPAPRFVDLGTCATVGGEVILDCRVAYRTAGTLNAARDNAVLIPTWYGGTSERLVRLLGDASMVDTTRFFVILADALGNGVSTSPSNSSAQHGALFPRLTIGDMVEAQRRLVREHFGITRLHAVVGFSMGAMQALEWAVRFPDEVDRVVSLLGSPRATAQDVFTMRSMRWMTRLAADDDLPADSSRVPLVDFWHVVAFTPERENERPVEALDTLVMRETAGWSSLDLHDNRLQLDAIIGNDVAAAYGGDIARAAERVRARVLFVVSPDDRVVNPAPAIAFAEATGAELLSVPSRCGHSALFCEPQIGERVHAFLARDALAGR